IIFLLFFPWIMYVAVIGLPRNTGIDLAFGPRDTRTDEEYRRDVRNGCLVAEVICLFILLLLFLIVNAGASKAAPAAKAAPPTGSWCLTLTVRNGHDTKTGAFIPPTKIFRRGTDCEAAKRIVVDPRSLRGLQYRLTDDGELTIEGWPNE